jgi:hypothetical protein
MKIVGSRIGMHSDTEQNVILHDRLSVPYKANPSQSSQEQRRDDSKYL